MCWRRWGSSATVRAPSPEELKSWGLKRAKYCTFKIGLSDGGRFTLSLFIAKRQPGKLLITIVIVFIGLNRPIWTQVLRFSIGRSNHSITSGARIRTRSEKLLKVILFKFHKLLKCRLAKGTESIELNIFSRTRGRMEQGLGHLSITSSSSHFFNKTDLEQYLSKLKIKSFRNVD